MRLYYRIEITRLCVLWLYGNIEKKRGGGNRLPKLNSLSGFLLI